MLPDLQAAIVRVKQATGVDLDSARALLVAPPSDTAVVSRAGGGGLLMKDEPEGVGVAYNRQPVWQEAEASEICRRVPGVVFIV
jgi:hypothetical protein